MSRLNRAVPPEAGCRIRIVAAHRGIPTVADARTVSIIPAHIPITDCTGAVIGDTNRTGKAIVPFVRHNIRTTASATGNTA